MNTVKNHSASGGRIELLAPAGGVDAGYAALHFGADAIYLGLKRFSARAEAVNLSAEELSEIVAYAHSLTPRRRVFVTINTLVLNHELRDLVEVLDAAASCDVDALIVQDLGVARIAQDHFPNLSLHGSTQMAIHNVQGAKVLRELGFRRVTLARELTIEEIAEIVSGSGIQVEVFIHGALCYSYSGLCLFSSQLRQRSGNRGRCTYPCRDAFRSESDFEGKGGTRERYAFPFSMKDLALPEHIESLRDAGVASLKIEGRMKSPLYVAATTKLYRGILDGKFGNAERVEIEDDIRTIFSRPWTKLYVSSRLDRDVVDSETVGHRGTRIGLVEAVIEGPPDKLRFKTSRAIEKHDGIQIDLPEQGKPYGFAVDRFGYGSVSSATEAPAGSVVEIRLPADHPELPVGAAVYCSSSQVAKQRYKYDRPKPGEFKVRNVVDICATLEKEKLTIIISPRGDLALCGVTKEFKGDFEQSRDPKATEEAFRSAFSKLGDTNLELGTAEFRNPYGLFVPVSRLNTWRREMCKELEDGIEVAKRRHADRIAEKYQGPTPFGAAKRDAGLTWSVKTDRLSHLSGFLADDWAGIAEAVVDIGSEAAESLLAGLEELESSVGRDRIRLALPIITRRWETLDVQAKIKRLLGDGWTNWEAGNLSAWEFLKNIIGGKGLPPSTSHEGDGGTQSFASDLHVTADWSLNVFNRAAILELRQLGARRFVLSPEDGIENMTVLAERLGEKVTAVVYQDTPLFISESCHKANLKGCKRKGDDCAQREEPMRLVSSGGDEVLIVNRGCRAITIGAKPFCVAGHIKKLMAAGITSVRADFVWRSYSAQEVVEIWRLLRCGAEIRGTHKANVLRGLM